MDIRTKKTYIVILCICLATHILHGMQYGSSTSLRFNNLPKVQLDLLSAYLYSCKKKYNQYPPTLLLEKIIEIINENNETFTPLTPDHSDWLQSAHTVISPTPSQINTFKMSPDGLSLALQYKDNSVQLFTTDNFTPITTDIFNHVSKYEFRPDGKQLFITDNDHSAHIYHTHNATPVKNGQFKNVADIEFSPNSQYLAIKDTNKTSQLYSTATDEVIPIDTGKFENIYETKFSPNSNYLYINYTHNSTKLFNMNTKELINQNLINIVKYTKDFSPNDQYLLLRYRDPSTQLSHTKLFHADDLSPVDITLADNPYSYSFSSDSQHLVIIYENKPMQLFNLKKLSHINIPTITCIPNSTYYEIFFSPDNKYVVIEDDDLYLQDHESKSVHFFKKKDFEKYTFKKVLNYTFSPDGQYILIKRKNKSFHLFNTKKFLHAHNHISPNTCEFKFSPDNRYILSYEESNQDKQEKRLSLHILDLQKELQHVNQKGLNLIDKLFKNSQNNNTTLTNDDRTSYNLLPTALKMALRKYISIKNT